MGKIYYMISTFLAQNVTPGRLAAVFVYGYSVCKSLVKRVLETNRFLRFLVELGSFLISALMKAKFHELLSRFGGWVSYFGVCSYNMYLHTILMMHSLPMFRTYSRPQIIRIISQHFGILLCNVHKNSTCNGDC